MNPTYTLFVASIASLGIASAQSKPSASLQALVESIVIPIHTAPADPAGGAYGTWAGAFDYKVRLADGFEFHPRLGEEAPRSLPLRWQTSSVRVGQTELLDVGSTVKSTPYRYEIDYGNITEAYDIRRQGVEQSWILHSRPAATAGDVVVTGVITTELVCAERAEAHRALRFFDGSKAVVEYGKAFAFDARGARTPIATQFDGERICLRVPQDFVDRATFPLTIDPLTTTVQIGPPNGYQDLTIVASRDLSTHRVIVGYTVFTAGSDRDAYVIVTNRDFAFGTVLFVDMTAAWSTNRVAATYCGGADAWAIGLERAFPVAGDTKVRCYVQPVSDTSPNGGTTMFVPIPSGTDHRLASIGGSWNGDTALVTFSEEPTAGGIRTQRGIRVLPLTATFGAQFRFSSRVAETLGSAQVVPLMWSRGEWVVAIPTSDSTVDHVKLARVSHDESAADVSVTTLRTLPSTEELFRPAPDPQVGVAGTLGRYLLAYAVTDTSQNQEVVRTIRFDWPTGSAQPTLIRERTLSRTTMILPPLGMMRITGVSYDLATQSHWTVTIPGAVHRLGYSGNPTESIARAGISRVAYSEFATDSEFLLLTDGPNLEASRLEYPANAISVPYGSSCAPRPVTVANGRSIAGNEFFDCTLQGLTPGASAFYLLGFLPTQLDLAPIGMPACSFAIDPIAYVTFPATANHRGDATVTFPLSDDSLFVGDLYSQWFYIDAAATPLPLRALHGVRHQVR